MTISSDSTSSNQQSNTSPVTPKEITIAIEACIKNRYPLLIVGSPGIGKTELVEQIALHNNFETIPLDISLCSPTDFRGLPVYDSTTRRASFQPYDNLLKIINTTTPTVVFLDDFGTASQALQASAMHLLSERRIGQFPISDQVTFILATNNKGEMSNVHGILEPVKSRCLSILHLTPSADDWLVWAHSNSIRQEVTGFIRMCPDLLHDFTPTNDFTQTPCPRSVEHVSDILNLNLPPAIQHSMIVGSVGEGFALQFLGFLSVFESMIDPDYILQNPTTVEIPTDPSIVWAYCSALTYKANRQNFQSIIQFADRLQIEYNVAMVHYDILARKPELAETKDYINWIAKYQDYLH